ncbi:MAG: 50S ribosomal protein L17 [Verrucomicrobiota bacterium]
MRHRRKTLKLGRKSEHRDALLSNLTISLIEHSRIKTTLAKAKAVRPYAEKLVTLGKKGELHHRRQAAAKLNDKSAVKKLFSDIAPRFRERAGGYTRILKLGQRKSDASEMALLEWVDFDLSAQPTTETQPEASQEEAIPKTPAKDDVVEVEAIKEEKKDSK